MLRDRRVQAAFAVGVVAWVLMGVAVVLLDVSNVALLGVVLITATWIQLGLLFYRRRPETPLAQAQFAFAQGDYAAAASTLEALPEKDVQAQTLLGNTYRQLGRLADSEAMLCAALETKPNDPFPLYGLGRTRLAAGDFDGAAQAIRGALEHGGRKAIRAELALAYALAGDQTPALQEAQRTARLLGLESHRILMTNAILLTGGDSLAGEMIRRSAEGLAYWRAEAARFAGSSYETALSSKIADIEAYLSKGETAS
jgi:tetratricopeptide (TPR) repeat protein